MSSILLESPHAVKQRRLKLKFRLRRLFIDPRAEEDKPVRIPESGLERRTAAPDDDLIALVVDYLEVIREFKTLLKCGLFQLTGVP